MKITRGHYNRKLLAFGVMAFLAIALISTGFAAWIMSSGAETGFDNGELTVGIITESDLKFADIEIKDGSTKLLFEPAENDSEGDIKWDGKNFESLTFTLTTKVSPADYLDEIKVSLKFPESVVAAHEAGYIVLPACAVSDNAMTIVKMTGNNPTTQEVEGLNVIAKSEVGDDTKTYITLEIKVTIKWGSVFGGQNPSTYLDGTSLSAYEKKVQLYNFKKTIFGLSFEEETDAEGKIKPEVLKEVFDYNHALKYSMKLIATVN